MKQIHSSLPEFTERTLKVGVETISYQDAGDGEATLLFIHGAFISKEYWAHQVAYFSTSYRVIAVDLAGHGNSSHNGTDWSFARYGHDLNEFIENLSLLNVILIGHSNGADIMLETIAQNTSNAIIGLVAVDYFKNTAVPQPEQVVSQTLINLKHCFSDTNEYYARHMLLTDQTNPEITERVVSDFRSMDPQVGIAFNEDAFRYTDRETHLLKHLPLKLYLINASYQSTEETNLGRLLEDNYELHTIEGTSHFPMLEKPNEFNKILEAIILKIDN